MKFIILFIVISFNLSLADGIFNHSKFGKLLEKYVSADGKVDYEKFINNNLFESYLKELAEANLKGFTDKEKLAFYLNAYNASVIKNVVNHYPISSPMEVEGFFKKKKFTIAGESLTLDELEYKKTASVEPVMMHFGLVCAAKSCPKLITKVYKAETVYDQLFLNAEAFLSDTTKNKIDEANQTIYFSEIFRWFKDTFETKFGSITRAAAILSGEKNLNKFDNYKIIFNKYNWELNGL